MKNPVHFGIVFERFIQGTADLNAIFNANAFAGFRCLGIFRKVDEQTKDSLPMCLCLEMDQIISKRLKPCCDQIGEMFGCGRLSHSASNSLLKIPKN